MAEHKSAKGTSKKKAKKPSVSAPSAPSAAKVAKAAAVDKQAEYTKLFALRQIRDDARAEILRAEFRLNRALNIKMLAGTDQDEEIRDARSALNAAREEASRSTQLFEVEKFAARKTTRW